MGIDAKHFYRFVYLKSEHWSNLRLSKLVESQARCCICDYTSHDNDVHHIAYKKLYDVRLGDLRVLCRRCHKDVHKLLEENFGINATTARIRFCSMARRLRKRRLLEWDLARAVVGVQRRQRDKRIHQSFKAARHRLRWSGAIINNDQMPWGKLMFRDYRESAEEVTDLKWLEFSQLRFPNALVWPCGEH